MAWEPDYITRDVFKNYLKIPLSDTQDDAELDSAITAASRAVDRCCSDVGNGLGARRQFGQVAAAEDRYYTPRWDNVIIRWVIEIDDIMDTTGFTLFTDVSNQDNWNQQITQFAFRPRDAIQNNRPYTQIVINPLSSAQPTYFVDSAKGNGKWGWTSFPPVVVQATKIQASRFFKRRVSPMGVAGSPQRSTEKSLLDKVDADIAQMLQQYDLIRLGWTV